MGYQINKAGWQCLWNGKNITEKIDPRLIELELTDKQSGEADELKLTITDYDGNLKTPKKGDVITLKMGWEQGSDVKTGLVNKGKFTVDEFPEISGPPDIISISAKSADFTGSASRRKAQNHIGKTLGAILREIAKNLNVTPKIDSDFENITVPAIIKTAKSDLALLKELGRKYDAIATIKNGNLIFAPVGATKTTTGKSLPAFTIDRTDAPQFRYAEQAREDTGGTETKYHDRRAAKTKKVTVKNGSSTKSTRKIRKIHANESDAQASAKAKTQKSARGTKTLELTLALGRPDIYAGAKITVTGYKPEINAITWIVKTATHKMGATGLATSLELESA